MNKKFTIYREDNGRIVSHGQASDPEALLRVGRVLLIGVDYAGGWMEGEQHHLMPDKPADYCVFNWATKQWEDPRTTETQWELVRLDRSGRLTASDWVVVKATETGEPVPQAWQNYRQALRDVANQPDPFSITWPDPP